MILYKVQKYFPTDFTKKFIECNNFIGLVGVDLEKQTGTVICSHKNYYRLEFDENEV